jgi:hypothetical protein
VKEEKSNNNFSKLNSTSFSGGRSRSTWREPPTMGKQLVNFITAIRMHPFCNLQSKARTDAILVIGLYENQITISVKEAKSNNNISERGKIK